MGPSVASLLLVHFTFFLGQTASVVELEHIPLQHFHLASGTQLETSSFAAYDGAKFSLINLGSRVWGSVDPKSMVLQEITTAKVPPPHGAQMVLTLPYHDGSREEKKRIHYRLIDHLQYENNRSGERRMMVVFHEGHSGIFHELLGVDNGNGEETVLQLGKRLQLHDLLHTARITAFVPLKLSTFVNTTTTTRSDEGSSKTPPPLEKRRRGMVAQNWISDAQGMIDDIHSLLDNAERAVNVAGKLATGDISGSATKNLWHIDTKSSATKTAPIHIPQNLWGLKASAEVEGDAQFEAELFARVAIDMHDYKIRSASVILHGDFKTGCTVTIKGSVSMKRTFSIGKWVLDPIAFAIGPVPVVMVPTVTLSGGLSADAHTQITAEAFVEGQLQAGFQFTEGDGFSPVVTHSLSHPAKISPSSKEPTELTAEAYLETGIAVLIDGIGGPSLNVRAGPKFEVVPKSDKCGEATVDIGVNVGIAAQLIGIHDKWSKSLFSYSKELAQIYFPSKTACPDEKNTSDESSGKGYCHCTLIDYQSQPNGHGWGCDGDGCNCCTGSLSSYSCGTRWRYTGGSSVPYGEGCNDPSSSGSCYRSKTRVRCSLNVVPPKPKEDVLQRRALLVQNSQQQEDIGSPPGENNHVSHQPQIDTPLLLSTNSSSSEENYSAAVSPVSSSSSSTSPRTIIPLGVYTALSFLPTNESLVGSKYKKCEYTSLIVSLEIHRARSGEKYKNSNYSMTEALIKVTRVLRNTTKRNATIDTQQGVFLDRYGYNYNGWIYYSRQDPKYYPEYAPLTYTDIPTPTRENGYLNLLVNGVYIDPRKKLLYVQASGMSISCPYAKTTRADETYAAKNDTTTTTTSQQYCRSDNSTSKGYLCVEVNSVFVPLTAEYELPTDDEANSTLRAFNFPASTPILGSGLVYPSGPAANNFTAVEVPFPTGLPPTSIPATTSAPLLTTPSPSGNTNNNGITSLPSSSSTTTANGRGSSDGNAATGSPSADGTVAGEKTGGSTGLIIGLVLAAIALVCGIAAAGLLISKKSSSRNVSRRNPLSDEEEAIAASSSSLTADDEPLRSSKEDFLGNEGDRP